MSYPERLTALKLQSLEHNVLTMQIKIMNIK